MDQLKLPDMYTCHLLNILHFKLYRNKLPAYFEKFIPEYGESQHDLRHNNIHLPAIRCEYEKMNAKYLGYEPADLTVHPPQKNDRGWVHFFRIGV